jgi:enterochelin esterase-like enzyme
MKRRFAFLLAALASALTSSAADDYQLGPDSLPKKGVPAGRVEGPILFQSQIFTNTLREYWVYVPAQYTPEKPACVMVFQDGHKYVKTNEEYRVPVVFDNLIAAKEMPVTIGIFITPGHRGTEMPSDRWKGNNRSFEYDSLGDAYARFLMEEMLPEVGKKYNLTKDPDGRAICGVSSGGICAFTVAWERPRPVSQGDESHRQLHRHPRRSRLSHADSQDATETAAHLPARRLERSR